MEETQERPDLGEQYAIATNATNLRVEADKRSAADILIAAGWSYSLTGMALLRLHSEWDGVQHPSQPTEKNIAAIADKLQRAPHDHIHGKEAIEEHIRFDLARRMEAAKRTADGWHAHEVALMLGRLKSLPEVLARLLGVVEKWKMKVGDPLEFVAELIMWWLDDTCPVCHGVIRDRAMHSKATCPKCKGTGKRTLPNGDAGRKMANAIDDSLYAARQSMKKRLRPAKT